MLKYIDKLHLSEILDSDNAAYQLARLVVEIQKSNPACAADNELAIHRATVLLQQCYREVKPR